MASEESSGRSVTCEITRIQWQWGTWTLWSVQDSTGLAAPAWSHAQKGSGEAPPSLLPQHPSIQGPQILFTLLTPPGSWSKPRVAEPRPLQRNCRARGMATALTERCFGNSPTAAIPGAVFNREQPLLPNAMPYPDPAGVPLLLAGLSVCSQDIHLCRTWQVPTETAQHWAPWWVAAPLYLEQAPHTAPLS